MENLDVRMMADRVLIKRKKPEEVTPGGIVLPDITKKRLAEGTVMASGPCSNTDVYEEAPIEEGDHVLFVPNGGVDITLKGEDYVVVSLCDIFLVVGSPED